MKGIKLFISGLTFTRESNQPFTYNAIAFLLNALCLAEKQQIPIL
jgi:hypothetical protein